MAAVAAAFLALGLAFGQTSNAVSGPLVTGPGALIQWGNADSSKELSDEDGIVTHPVRAPVNHRRHKRHRHLQPKHVALGAQRQRVYKHHHRGQHRRARRARHSNKSNMTAVVSANSTDKLVAHSRNHSDEAPSHFVQSNSTSRSLSELVAWKTAVSEADPAHLSTLAHSNTLNSQVYSSQAAPQIILDKEQKIGKLEEQNDRVAVEFHKLDAAYRDQQVQMTNLRRRFENDQDSIAKGTKELQEAFTHVAEKEDERKKLMQEQQSVEKVIESEKAKNAHLLQVLQLKDNAERTLREQSTKLRKQVASDQQNTLAMEAGASAELQNQTKMLEIANLKGQKLKQELKTLATRLKDQQVDKEDLKHQQETLTEENNRLTEQNEKLEHLQREKVDQLKALQGEVRDDRTEHAELQHELDTLETTGAVPPASSADFMTPVADIK